MPSPRYRLAVVVNRPQPYHSALFRALAAHAQIDLTVYYLFDVGVGAAPDPDFGRFQWDSPVLEGYRSHFLRNRAAFPAEARFAGSFHPELCARLHPRFHDAVVIHGWFGLSVWLALLTCRQRKLPVLMRSSAHATSPDWKHATGLRHLVLRGLFRRCSAFLTLGRRNTEFYRRWGVPEEKLFLTPHAVDNDYFGRQRAAWLPQRPIIRQQLGLPADAVVFLYAGRLAPEKRLPDLLHAVRALDDARAWLVLAGEGRERRHLENLARSIGLRQILFPGFQSQSGLARFYVAADAFVLPSGNETWGLVVNEAMNFALPVVVSDAAGAVPDLVEEGGNGMVFPAGDRTALRCCLRRLLTDASLRTQIGERSLERIQRWSHHRSAESVLRALEFATGARPRTYTP